MEHVLRTNFGSACETFSPSEGCCDLFVPATQRWLSLKQVRALARQHRWKYEIVIEGGQTRVRFMMGSPLWDLEQRPAPTVVANVTVKHALDNGYFFPSPNRTRTELAGTTETVHIDATPGRQTRVSVPLSEALLDRAQIIDIQLRKGSASIVCVSQKYRVEVATAGHGSEPRDRTEQRIARRLAKILRRRVSGAVLPHGREARARSAQRLHQRAGKRAGNHVSRLPRRTVPGAVCDGAAAAATAAAR
mgnify:CR=1 FL=1